MRIRPLVLFLLAVVLLAVTWVLEMTYVTYAGFPDGAMTAYDRMMLEVVWAFNRFSLLVAAWLIWLAIRARRRDCTSAFLATLALYVVVVCAVIVLDNYFWNTLPNPQGG